MAGKINKCEKCIAKKCKGVLLDPIKSYSQYAYWCGIKQEGWFAKPCKHQKG